MGGLTGLCIFPFLVGRELAEDVLNISLFVIIVVGLVTFGMAMISAGQLLGHKKVTNITYISLMSQIPVISIPGILTYQVAIGLNFFIAWGNQDMFRGFKIPLWIIYSLGETVDQLAFGANIVPLFFILWIIVNELRNSQKS